MVNGVAVSNDRAVMVENKMGYNQETKAIVVR